MFNRPRILLGVAAAAAALALPAAASADNGSPTCLNGYVWREAYAGDRVCVTPGVRTQTQADNRNAVANRDPNAGFGPYGCRSGLVWRVARPSDLVCVSPQTRAQAAADNDAGPWRRNFMGLSVGRRGGFYTVTVSGVNLGKVSIVLYRLGTGKFLKGWNANAVSWAKPGGLVSGFKTSQPVCSGPNDAYFKAIDGSSGLRSAPVYVSGRCVLID